MEPTPVIPLPMVVTGPSSSCCQSSESQGERATRLLAGQKKKAHTVVLERNFGCVQCHRESPPLALDAVQLDRHTLIQAFVICHGSVKE